MPDQLAETRTRHLEELVARDPATALYLPLAERLRDEGRVEEAIRLCEARKNRPGHGVGDAIVLGRCYLADGRLNEARSEFEAALALDRENVSALKALAGILAHEGRHTRAIDLYRAVCRVDPGDLESQTALHQITSGEYAEVCPADVVVGQGDLGWQPVKLPREEEHLSDLALGLRTIETFDEAAADPTRERNRSFRELSLDELEHGTAKAPAPEALVEAPLVEALEASDEPAMIGGPNEAPIDEMIDAPPIDASIDARSNAPTDALTEVTDAPFEPFVPRPPEEVVPEESALPAPAEIEAADVGPEPIGRAGAREGAADPNSRQERAFDRERRATSPGPTGGNRSAFEDWLRRLGGGS